MIIRLAAAVALACIAQAAPAATVTWDGETSTDWFEPTNWDTNTEPGIDDDVVLDGPDDFTDQIVISGASTARLDLLTIGPNEGGLIDIINGGVLDASNVNISESGSVDVTGAGSRLDVSGQLAVGTAANGGGLARLAISSGATASCRDFCIFDAVTGTAFVAVEGAGSSLTGPRLRVGSDNPGTTIPDTLDIRNGASVTFDSGSGGGAAVIGDNGGNGAVTVGAGSALTLSGDFIDAGSPNIIMGEDGGTGTLTIEDGGTVTLTENGTGGPGTLNLAGLRNVTDPDASGTLTIDGGVLDAAAVFGGDGTATLNFTHGKSDYFFTRDGTAGGAPVAITGSTFVNHIGNGTTTLLGPHTLFDGQLNSPYTGGTRVANGTLRAGNADAFPDATAYTVDGGTLDLNGFDLTAATLAGSGGTLALGGATLTVDQATDTGFAGTIAGTGSLTKQGAGILTLTGNNTYSGGTTVAAGTLAIGDGGSTGSITGDVVNDATLAFDRVDTLTFAGDLSGSGQLRQTGAGTLVLTGTNTHSGGTTVANGTLQIGDGGTSGSIAGDVTNDGVLAFNRADALTFGGVISGSGSVTQQGTGTLTLTGANTYTGGTIVDNGTLRVNGSVASATSVNSGATLGGNGTTATVTVSDGGALAPGASAGTLTTGALTLAGASVLDYELAAPGVAGGGVNDLIDVQGDLVLDGALNITDLGGFGRGTYTLITYSGTLTDNGLEIAALPDGFTATLDTSVSGEVSLGVVAPTVELDPALLEFAERTVGTTSEPRTVTLMNTGNADLSLGALGVTGAHPEDFALPATSDQCSGMTLAPADSCTFAVTFRPAASGARSAAVTIPSDAPSSPDSVTLSGTGLAAPELMLSASLIDFGDQPLGVPSPAEVITITNIGAGDLVLDVLGLTGRHPDDYMILTDGCSTALLVTDESCQVELDFAPMAPGIRRAELAVPSNDPAGPHAVELIGTNNVMFFDGFEDNP